MKKKGFTLIEVVVAFTIFSLILVFVMRLNHTTSTVMNLQRTRLKKLYIAQLAMEEYKDRTVTLDSDVSNTNLGNEYKVHITIVNNVSQNSIINGKNEAISTRTIKVTVTGGNPDTDVELNNDLIN